MILSYKCNDILKYLYRPSLYWFQLSCSSKIIKHLVWGSKILLDLQYWILWTLHSGSPKNWYITKRIFICMNISGASCEIGCHGIKYHVYVPVNRKMFSVSLICFGTLLYLSFTTVVYARLEGAHLLDILIIIDRCKQCTLILLQRTSKYCIINSTATLDV